MKIYKLIEEFHLKDLLFIPNRRWLVYILINKDEVVYIGKSDVNGFSRRLSQHKGNFKFTDARFIETGSDEQITLDIEKGLISACKPINNTVHKDFSARKVNGMIRELDQLSLNLPKTIIETKEVYFEKEFNGVQVSYKELKKWRDLFFFYWLRLSLFAVAFSITLTEYYPLSFFIGAIPFLITKKKFRREFYKANPFSKYNSHEEEMKRIARKYSKGEYETNPTNYQK